ncbi:MAG: SCP2 sterol-binding domain-containing protein [Saprospiraceae bacterium]
MTFNEISEKIQSQAHRAPQLGKTLKLVLGSEAEVIYVDMTTSPAVITHDNKDADCTIVTTIETLEALRSGSLNPMMAVMSGKIKIKGDMGVAMQLQSLLSGSM